MYIFILVGKEVPRIFIMATICQQKVTDVEKKKKEQVKNLID